MTVHLFKNRIILIIIFLSAFNFVHQSNIKAQKLKKTRVSFTYIAYPTDPLPSYIHTYMIDIKGDYQKDENVKKLIRETIKLGEYKQVMDKSAADLIIELNLTKMSPIKKEKKGKTEKVDDKPITKYWYEFNYTMPIKMQLVFKKFKYEYFKSNILKKVQNIKTDAFEGSYLETIYTPEKINKLCFNHSLEAVQERLTKYYSGDTKYLDAILFSAKRKKTKYPELKLAIKQTNYLLKKDVVKELSAENKIQLQKNIDIWEKAISQADTIDDKARINKDIYYGLAANLTFAYILTTDFDRAWFYYKKIKTYQKRNYDIENAVRKLTNFFSIYQNNYILHNKNYKIGKLLSGNWKVTSIIAPDNYDLNKDGKSSKNILTEYDKCKKYIEYRFFNSRKLTSIEGNEQDGCKSKIDDELFWSVRTNKVEERRFLLIGDEANFDPQDASQFRIIRIWYGGLVIYGYSYIEGDTTTPVEMHLIKIL